MFIYIFFSILNRKIYLVFVYESPFYNFLYSVELESIGFQVSTVIRKLYAGHTNYLTRRLSIGNFHFMYQQCIQSDETIVIKCPRSSMSTNKYCSPTHNYFYLYGQLMLLSRESNYICLINSIIFKYYADGERWQDICKSTLS